MAVAAIAGPAAADTVKVGVIGPFSGPYALFGKGFRTGVEAYVAEHGRKAGGHDVEFVYKDLDGPSPARAKALAQELVVKDRVGYLAGFYLTPNALAVTPLLEEAKVPLVVFNAATSAITEKSPYVVRTSFTMWQNTVPAAQVAVRQGARKVAIAVSDYAPGIDAETAFRKSFEASGGTVVEAVRMALSMTDFAPVMQRLADSGADTVFAFLPSGPATLGFVKAFHQTGLKDKGIRLLTTGDLVPEPDLPALGEAGLGILSTYHYAVSHDSPENARFLAAVEKAGGKRSEVTMATVAAYDGAHLLYRMIGAAGAERAPDKALAAVKDYGWISPRGPVRIDPQSRHIRQTVYLRVVERKDGTYLNRELDAFPDQPDHGFGLGR
ncbi:ABC transporter substrate-binding protein [Azospirillum thermophilum]|nr:ABC transporter substrate-binding protein [Azospirillum thermophilum]